MSANAPGDPNFPEFAEEIRGEVRACLFGVSEGIDRAILTPIPFIFNRFDSWPMVDPRGWWPARFDSGTACVLVPQSTAILDAVAAMDPGTEIVFVGLAGSLGALRIGDAVEVVEALHAGEVVPRSATAPLLFPAARAVGVTCLSESMSRWQTLAASADCVDMETSLVYVAARAQRKPATSIVIISDDLQTHPFYAAQPSHSPASLTSIVGALQRRCSGTSKSPRPKAGEVGDPRREPQAPAQDQLGKEHDAS